MFDNAVVSEGVGQIAQLERRAQAQGGVRGTSPDGLGAYVQPEPGDYGYPHAQPTASSPNPPQRYAQPQEQLEGAWDFIEPDTTSSGAAARSAGFTLLFVAMATGVGYALKGGLGACAGALLAGGAANGYRAQKWWDTSDPSEKHEAIVSTVLAVVEVGAGGYVGWKAIQEGARGRGKKE